MRALTTSERRVMLWADSGSDSWLPEDDEPIFVTLLERGLVAREAMPLHESERLDYPDADEVDVASLTELGRLALRLDAIDYTKGLVR